MLRHAYLIVSIATSFLGTAHLNAQSPIEIQGEATNNLKPSLSIQKLNADWSVEIEFTAQTNFSERSWLKIANHFGSKLRLWTTNGIEIQPTNLIVSTSQQFPIQTTVLDVLSEFHPANLRGLQW